MDRKKHEVTTAIILEKRVVNKDKKHPVKLRITYQDKKKLVAQHIQTTNKYMKRIAKNISIDTNISTYYARHSYSTIIRDSGASTEFISEQLGHRSTKVTQNYIDSFQQDTKEKFQKAIIPMSKNK